MFRVFLLILAVTLPPLNSYAQQSRQEEPSPIDVNFMSKQHASIDNLARRHLGRQLNGQKDNDFRVLQLLLDQQLVKPDQRELLQAMGVVFGNIIKTQQGLRWTIYTDRYGRSRALAISGQREVIFPVTMISRRVETGGQVDIEALYQKALKKVAEIRKIIIVH